MSTLLFAMISLHLLFTGLDNDCPNEYYRNYRDDGSETVVFPKCAIIHDSMIDVRHLSFSSCTPLATSLVSVLGPKLLPSDWQEYNFYLYGRLRVYSSIASYVICAESYKENEQEKQVFMLNLHDDHLVSSVALSHDFYFSDTNKGHVFSVLNDKTITIYENIVLIYDETQETESVTIPLYVKIRYRVKRLFDHKQNTYTCFQLSLNQKGELHIISSLHSNKM